MGHISFRELKKVPELCKGVGRNIERFDGNVFCKSCAISKLTKKPFNTTKKKATRPL